MRVCRKTSPSHRGRLALCGTLLALAVLAGCRQGCGGASLSQCELAGPVRTIRSPAGAPRLLSVARDSLAGMPGRRARPGEIVASWIDGAEGQARVVVARLGSRGELGGALSSPGQGGPPALISAVAMRGDRAAVVWMAGTQRRARLLAALLPPGAARPLEVAAEGPLTDPAVAYIDQWPWVVWAAAGSIRARALSGPDAGQELELVKPDQDAFWPLLAGLGPGVALTYLTARSGYDLRLASGPSVRATAAVPSLRIPRSMHLSRLEHALAADSRGLVVAWSQVLAAAGSGGTRGHHIQAARLTPKGALQHMEGMLDGLGPAVAPGAEGSVAVAWLRPLTHLSALVHVGLLFAERGRPVVLRLEEADLRNGRPVLVAASGGLVVLWIRQARRPDLREVRVARVLCR